MIELLIRDVPEGIYRTPWHRAYSLEITVEGRHLVYFLGCSDAVWSPPEPLWKAVTLIEDAFPINEASRKQALGEIRSRLARQIPHVEFDGAPLKEIIGFAREYSDVPMDVCWDERRSYGVPPDLRMHVVTESITVEQLLGRVLSAVNAVAGTRIVATVHSGGVFMGLSCDAGGLPHPKGDPPVPGSRELALFHVINFSGGDFAMSVDADGRVLYGERRRNKISTFTDRGLELLRQKIRAVQETVPSGHYRASFGHEVVLEIPVRRGSRLYVLTTSVTDPNMPEALDELQGAMSGLSNW
jgi:hypothetical protein